MRPSAKEGRSGRAPAGRSAPRLVAAALLDADADRSRFVRAIGSTDSVVDERRRMDEIKATEERSDVSFSNRRAFTHDLTAAEREWFRGGLAVADRWC